MKSLMYLLKRNQVSFLAIPFFVFHAWISLAQPSPQGMFARLTMLKIQDGQQQEFESFAREHIKPLQSMRKQKGEIVLWILFKAHFAGDESDYNYVGVEYSTSWEGTERKAFAAMFKEVNPDGDVAAFLARQRELRAVVREHILYQLDGIEPNPPAPSRYVRIDYMKAKPGRSEDYVNAERTDSKPFHQARIKEGRSSGWGLWKVIFSGGEELAYDFVTSNRYNTYGQVLTTDYEGTTGKTVSSKRPADIRNNINQLRDLVKSELWEVVEIMN